MSEMTLADLVPGESGMVVGIEGKGMLAQRLVDMGLYSGVLAKLIRKAPLVSVIMPIDCDHTTWLGSDIADIAREKAVYKDSSKAFYR